MNSIRIITIFAGKLSPKRYELQISERRCNDVAGKRFCIMKTVEVIVEHAGKNLSAYIEGAPVITVGNDIKEIEDNMKEAIELYLEDNPNPCEVLSGEFELKFKIDAATFINYYSSIFTKAALSRITGINERQLWHYAAGVHKPRRQQLEKIQKGIQSLSRELSAINLL